LTSAVTGQCSNIVV